MNIYVCTSDAACPGYISDNIEDAMEFFSNKLCKRYQNWIDNYWYPPLSEELKEKFQYYIKHYSSDFSNEIICFPIKKGMYFDVGLDNQNNSAYIFYKE